MTNHHVLHSSHFGGRAVKWLLPQKKNRSLFQTDNILKFQELCQMEGKLPSGCDCPLNTNYRQPFQFNNQRHEDSKLKNLFEVSNLKAYMLYSSILDILR